jgi:transposase
VVVADECRLQEEPNPFYRWNTKGKTPIVKILQSKDNVSFYGGLSMNQGKLIAHLCDWQNSEETCKFLDKIKDEYSGADKPILLIWDQASWHKSQRVKQWLKENPGVVELILLPPYSPDLNQQENVWKALRKDLSEIANHYTFREVVDRACRFLLTKRFDFKLI